MAKPKIKENRKKWDKLKKEMSKMKGAKTKIGVFGNEDQSEDGTDMLLIAGTHEFGSEDGTIPERSFIRSTYDDKQGEMLSLIDDLRSQIIAGKITVEAALEIVGAKHEAMVKDTINDPSGPGEALSESTKSRKGSSNPLVDEGRLRDSIRYVLEGV